MPALVTPTHAVHQVEIAELPMEPAGAVLNAIALETAAQMLAALNVIASKYLAIDTITSYFLQIQEDVETLVYNGAVLKKQVV